MPLIPPKSVMTKNLSRNQNEALMIERDLHHLQAYAKDFGKIVTSQPAGFLAPKTLSAIQNIFSYANAHDLKITIRGDGLSQGGQCLAEASGVIVSTNQLQVPLAITDDRLWVNANTTFREILTLTLKKGLTLPVIPYNLSLSVGGVLSAGGIGASSFRLGPLVSQVNALEVVTTDSKCHLVNSKDPLFHACLGGQGCFGLITKASFSLQPAPKNVMTVSLLYNDISSLQADVKIAKTLAYGIEMFCSQAPIGAKLVSGERKPFSLWSYILNITVSYHEKKPPILQETLSHFTPKQVLTVIEEPYFSWASRHDGRFLSMQQLGQWALYHPWYECFVSSEALTTSLPRLIEALPAYYCPILQIAPVHHTNMTGLFMLPEASEIYACMILTPGVLEAMLPSCLKTINALDALFLPQGGKRYLSGFLGKQYTKDDWKRHYGPQYETAVTWKKIFDPKGILGSLLHAKTFSSV